MLRIVVFFTVLALALVPADTVAQSYDNPGLGEKPVASHPPDYKPLGVRAGSFMLHPGIELAAQYHDNILYTDFNEVSDTIFHVRPYITAQSNWSRHSLTARLSADIGRYDDYDFRDYEDYFLQIGGTVDVASRSAFSYGFDYMELHEERNIRSVEQGIEPTTYDLTGANLGFDHLFNRLSVGLLYDFRSMEYDNNINLEGEIIDNTDRDRDEHNVSARIGYQFKSDKQAFLSIAYGENDYDRQLDRNGFDRNSSGYSIGAGINFSVTGVLAGDVSIDYSERDYDDPRLRDVDGWGLGAGLTWMPTMLTTVRGTVTTSIEDTTQSTSSGYFRTMYSLRADHELRRNLQLMAQLSYYDNDYELLPGVPDDARDEDNYLTADIGATYYFNRHSWLSASYKYGNFDTNVPNDDFKANSAWLVFGLER